MPKTTKEKVEELKQYPIYAHLVLTDDEIESPAIVLEDFALLRLTTLMHRHYQRVSQMNADLLHKMTQKALETWIESHRSTNDEEIADSEPQPPPSEPPERSKRDCRE